MFSYNLVDFVELSMFTNVSLPLKFYLMKWIWDLYMGKNIFLYIIYIFFKKAVTIDLN